MLPPAIPVHHGEFQFNAYQAHQDMNSLSSRSTSGFIDPSLQDYGQPTKAGLAPQAVLAQPQPKNKHYELRLPSDQLRQLIAAFGSRHEASSLPPNGAPTAQMVPPIQPSTSSAGQHLQSDPLENTNVEHSTTPRHASLHQRNFSDVSMHVGCNDFPDCTLDDPHGLGLIHQSISAPVRTPVPASVQEADIVDLSDDEAALSSDATELATSSDAAPQCAVEHVLLSSRSELTTTTTATQITTSVAEATRAATRAASAVAAAGSTSGAGKKRSRSVLVSMRGNRVSGACESPKRKASRTERMEVAPKPTRNGKQDAGALSKEAHEVGADSLVDFDAS